MNISLRLFITFILIAGSAVAQAKTSLYEISKGDQKIYLGGTIHLLRSSDFPLPREFLQAYDSAATLVLEVDMQKAAAPEFGQRLTQVMTYTDGKNLQSELTPALWNELQAYTAVRKIPLENLRTYKPFLVSLILTMAEGQRLLLGEGVDAYFNQKARANNKPLGALESTDDVLAAMQLLTDLDANEAISGTLRDLQNMESMMGTMVKAWRTGNLNKLDKQMAEPMRKSAPGIYQALIVQRNQKWLPQIEAMLTTPETEMVLVGSLHLSGAEGLLQQLKKKGYKIKPYQLPR